MSDSEEHNASAGTATVAVSADQFAQLMSAINATQSRLDTKLAEFQEEIRQGQEVAAAKAVKRARYEKPFTYRRRGNEEQATFNARVDESLAQAEGDLASVTAGPSATSALRRVKEAIQQGWRLLDERQKLIRLADRSEHGWGVVDEYTADDLADDSDDERRIEKVERAAERKAGKRRKQRQAPGTRASPARFPDAGTQTAVPGMSREAPPFSQTRWPAAVARPVGPCHFCGEMGHLRLYCLVRTSGTSGK